MATEPPDYWEEREASKKVPGLYANHVYVQHLGNGLVRVNFGEVLDEEPRYHSAVVLTGTDAAEFAKLIHRMGTAAEAVTIQAVQDPPAEDRARENENG